MPPQDPEQQNKPQLENHTIGLMVAVALFYDVLQALLNIALLGWLVSPVALLTFYVWFKTHGVKFASAKRAGIMSGGFLVELIPLLNTLPAWTLAVVLISLDTEIKK